MIKIIRMIQIPADSFVSDTNGFINFSLRSMAIRGERQFLKVYANHTMLTPPQRAGHFVIFKISISACRDPKNWTSRLNGSKLNYIFQQSNTQLMFFQNPQILRTITSGHDVIHTPATFSIWGLLWQMVIVISFAHERKTAPIDYAPGLRDPNSSKPY